MFALNLRTLHTTAADFEAEFARLRHWSAEEDAAIEQRVADILADVRRRGDAAVLDYTTRFDGVQAASLGALELTREELKAAFDAITPAQRSALQAAAQRVRSYHERQLQASGQSWSYRDEDGTLLGQKVTPLDRVGIYVPGGKAAYPSSVLMNAIPAHVAGVGEIIMVVPTPKGEKNALVLAAAYVAGVTRAFTIGGAQAVAALAYGTATVPAVDKITGPGNAYVASAKRRVFGQVGIDMIAGPSEILVIADGRDPHRWEPALKHAGAIFLGAYTSESLGDYCAGPNHVLPTSGTARFSSPLGTYDFQKRSSLIEVSEAGAQTLGVIAAELAYGEGLQGHARAAEMRLKR
ncbi:MAG: histidinol dehydrogenase [Ideonella sp. MAG2]|nr:MAG: histidinol dehydrogenase [Ideonella sp. MAG2]